LEPPANPVRFTFDLFLEAYGPKYDKAVARLEKDRGQLARAADADLDPAPGLGIRFGAWTSR
jgi:hypothetical protein